MNQFDKNIKIELSINDANSLKQALIEYQNYLRNDKAVFNSLFDIEFVAKDADGHRRLQISDTENIRILKDSLNMAQEGGRHYYPKHITEDMEIYVSEAIFFAMVLEYPELKEQMISTAQSMVELSRRYNDTSDMWVDDMRIFGVEALYMIARTYPEYSYLLAQFIIPYWDDEHAVGYQDYLHHLVEINGWTQDMIKAFVWCDNHHFRQCMNNENAILGQEIKKNPESYFSFVKTLNQRLEEELFLSTIDDSDGKEFILDLFFSLFWVGEEYYEVPEDHKEVMDQFFITNTIEYQALNLYKKLSESFGENLFHKALAAVEEEEWEDLFQELKENYEFGNSYRELKSTFIHLPNGEEIWNYIQTGESSLTLKKISETALLPLFKNYSKYFYSAIKHHIGSRCDEENLRYYLFDIIKELSFDFVDFEEEFGFDDEDTFGFNGDELRLAYLRILDVFFYCFGKKKFPRPIHKMIDYLVELNCLTKEESIERYKPE
ncbi:MAG: hypothetical protein N4A49_02650 [Marinifilaceae bacterium]|jgi:hypothetical protein|nr:hypothetical protein [Marinifilaceae bacterium]